MFRYFLFDFSFAHANETIGTYSSFRYLYKFPIKYYKKQQIIFHLIDSGKSDGDDEEEDDEDPCTYKENSSVPLVTGEQVTVSTHKILSLRFYF